MARCPLCGATLNWAELIEQMLSGEVSRDLFEDPERFRSALEDFVFKCPHCGEEFYGKNLPSKEVDKVFELLREFKGSINWDEGKVRLRLNSLLALDTMLEKWDENTGGRR